MKLSNPLIAGVFLFSLSNVAVSQEMPPRQIGDLDVNALTSAPLWTIQSVELDAGPSEVLEFVFKNQLWADAKNKGAEQMVGDTPASIVAWQLDKSNPEAVTNHLGVISVNADMEDGVGSIVSISSYFDHTDVSSALPYFERAGKSFSDTLVNEFGGDFQREVTGVDVGKIVITRLVNAPREKVWKVVADDFADVAQWSSLISEAKFFSSNHDNTSGILGGSRQCFIPAFGTAIDERVVTYDKENSVFAYEIKSGLPPFVTKGFTTFTLDSLDDNTTQLSATMTMQIAPGTPGLPIGMAKENFSNAMNLSLDELAFFIENDKPHPRELASR